MHLEIFSSEIARSLSSLEYRRHYKAVFECGQGLEAIEKIGRGERIRTSDPLVPNSFFAVLTSFNERAGIRYWHGFQRILFSA